MKIEKILNYALVALGSSFVTAMLLAVSLYGDSKPNSTLTESKDALQRLARLVDDTERRYLLLSEKQRGDFLHERAKEAKNLISQVDSGFDKLAWDIRQLNKSKAEVSSE